MAGKKGKSGRKNKSFEFEVNKLKELSLRRAIRTLEAEIEIDQEDPIGSLKASLKLDKRKDEVMLKVLDKAIPTKIEGEGFESHKFIVMLGNGQPVINADNHSPETVADRICSE